MSINKQLFDSIYDECCKIIQFSQDKLLLQKKDKLDYSYKQLCETEDCELQEFYSIVHELRTYYFLCNNNLTVHVQDDNHIGPDFLCSEIGYIECISITKGAVGTECRKYVEKCLSRSMNRYLAALPRITSAIIDKKNKYETYLSKQAIDPNIPRLIAINTSIFSNEFNSDSIIDLLLKILYGIGCQIMRVKINPISFVEENGVESHQYNDIGKKHSDLDLELNYFAKADFRNISAIILENNAIGENDISKYFFIFTNPLANVPIEIKNLKNIKTFIQEKADESHISYKWLKPKSPIE